jgi:hypothetical protein
MSSTRRSAAADSKLFDKDEALFMGRSPDEGRQAY